MEDRFFIGGEYFLVIDGCRKDVGDKVDIELKEGTKIYNATLNNINENNFEIVEIEILYQTLEIQMDDVEDIK